MSSSELAASRCRWSRYLEGNNYNKVETPGGLRYKMVQIRAVRRQKKVAKKGASYRRLRRLLRHLYIVDAVLEASGR